MIWSRRLKISPTTHFHIFKKMWNVKIHVYIQKYYIIHFICVCVMSYIWCLSHFTKDTEERAGWTGSVAYIYIYKTCCWLAIHLEFITTQLCSGCNSGPLEPPSVCVMSWQHWPSVVRRLIHNAEAAEWMNGNAADKSSASEERSRLPALIKSDAAESRKAKRCN